MAAKRLAPLFRKSRSGDLTMTDNSDSPGPCQGAGIDESSWQRLFARARGPFDEFIHNETSSGIVLMIATALALLLANSGYADLYESILHTELAIGPGSWRMTLSLHHWINDGLMALFFFIVGLEIKREMLVGHLADRRQAILPVAGALGGMLLPALIYALVNSGLDSLAGWGIPMATDIAFALGVLALLGRRIPRALVGFLLALAIIDDLGAVLVIALFYTDQIHLLPLSFAGACFVALAVGNRAGLRRPLFYAAMGLLMWIGMMKSGIHATLAGVLTAMTVPAGSLCRGRQFAEIMEGLSISFREVHTPGKNILENEEQQRILQSMANNVHRMESPLQRMEHGLHVWVSFLIIPLFALANAGISFDLAQFGSFVGQPVTLGIMAGLVFGKSVGVLLFSWLVIRLGWCRLPPSLNLPLLAGASLLAGIGFTMAFFIAGLAFPGQQAYLVYAKLGIFLASLVAGVAGYLLLRLTSGKGWQEDHTGDTM